MELRKSDKYIILIVVMCVIFIFSVNIKTSKIYQEEYRLSVFFIDIPGPLNIAISHDYEYNVHTIIFTKENVVDQARLLNNMGIFKLTKSEKIKT